MGGLSTLGELAQLLGARLVGAAELQLHGVAELSQAGEGEIAPLFDAERRGEALAGTAAALLLPQRLERLAPELGRSLLISADPRRALGLLLAHFAPPPVAESGIHATAIVATTAQVDPSAYVGPFCLIEADARVGAASRLEAYCHLGARATLGRACRLASHAVVGADCALADGVELGPGSVVGADGFGYWRDDQGWHRIRSAGGVALDAGVELGANSCVDRATLGVTRVGAGSKLDNLVQVGHNVQLGQRTLLCAQVGLAGSVRLGDDVVLGGQVGVADQRRIGAGARVGAGSGVVSDVPAAQTVSGYPALDHRRWLRASVLFGKLDQLSRSLRQLAGRMDRLDGDRDS